MPWQVLFLSGRKGYVLSYPYSFAFKEGVCNSALQRARVGPQELAPRAELYEH